MAAKKKKMPQRTGTRKAQANVKRNRQKQAGKRKGGKSRFAKKAKNKKRSVKKETCWDPFPMSAHEVHDVNKTNKNILVSVTCLFLCTSLGLLCLGSYLVEERKARQELASVHSFPAYMLNVSLVILSIGLVSLIITLCGCIGVLRENITMIRIFYIFFIVALLLKLSAATFLLVLSDYSRPMLEKMFVETAVTDYRTSSDVETLMDYLQLNFRCCGIDDNGFTDWSRSIYFNCSSANPSPERCGVPWSCCRNGTGLDNALCGHNVQQLDRNIASRTIYTMGCMLALQEYIEKHAICVGLLILLEAVLKVVVIFQCTHLVNELQMINGVYRGPWWETIGKRKPPRTPPEPPGTPPTPTPTEVTKPSAVQVGFGPAVRRAPRPAPEHLVPATQVEVATKPEQVTREEQVFLTSFKGAVTDNDETELSELAEAALTFLSEASGSSYFCPPDPRDPEPSSSTDKNNV